MCVHYIQASPEEHSQFSAGSGISSVGCLRDKTHGFELSECSEGLGVFCRKPVYAALSPPGLPGSQVRKVPFIRKFFRK